MPLAATLASGEVFDAFSSASKLDALLHGHSYSGYPIGCAAAVAALGLISGPQNPSLCLPERCAPDLCSGTVMHRCSHVFWRDLKFNR